MIVTIDGPAGAGKSTAARLLAARLGFDFLDTGAMYRTVALAAQRHAIQLTDGQKLDALLDAIRIGMHGDQVFLNDEPVGHAIRTPEITHFSRGVADSPIVRRHLSDLQRRIADGSDLVTEGRDQGTIVFPEAECKFFLTADAGARALRRFGELQRRGATSTLHEVLAAQTERDARDAERAIAPMRPAADAIFIDSTALTIDEVVDGMERYVRSKMNATHRKTPSPRYPTDAARSSADCPN